VIELFPDWSTVDAKTSPCRVRLANPNHTVDMNEAEIRIAPITPPVNENDIGFKFIGTKHRKLTFISFLGRRRKGSSKKFTLMFLTKCDCGIEKTMSIQTVRASVGCGCTRLEAVRKAVITHGMSETPEYRVWTSMFRRCRNKNDKSYKDYGGRGISVCDRWRNFSLFVLDMGLIPEKGYSIERKFVDGNYEPENCRWATRKEQNRNTRRNKFLKFGGKTKCVSEWSEEVGIDGETIIARVDRYGWTVEKALTTPVRK
jgi:hypothetical protein